MSYIGVRIVIKYILSPDVYTGYVYVKTYMNTLLKQPYIGSFNDHSSHRFLNTRKSICTVIVEENSLDFVWGQKDYDENSTPWTPILNISTYVGMDHEPHVSDMTLVITRYISYVSYIMQPMNSNERIYPCAK